MIEWGSTGGSATDFLAFALQLRKPPKTPVQKPSGTPSSSTSHCLKWSHFPPNEVGRATLPAPPAKPIGTSQKSVLKNLRSGIRRSRDLGSVPPGHSSKLQLLRACIPKYMNDLSHCKRSDNLKTGLVFLIRG